jgi:uracil-DNA glycosylase
VRPKPRFGHAREFTATTPDLRAIRVVGCYHVSPHNTYTGRLTTAMLDEVLLSLRE